MGQDCCMQREKEQDVMKKYTDKLEEDKEKKKEEQEKLELEKNANAETAQTIEFPIDYAMESGRLSQLSDGPEALIAKPMDESNKIK